MGLGRFVTGIASSNPAQGTDECARLSVLCRALRQSSNTALKPRERLTRFSNPHFKLDYLLLRLNKEGAQFIFTTFQVILMTPVANCSAYS